jgi:isoquinoline 1-oxidoreductase beta subunit
MIQKVTRRGFLKNVFAAGSLLLAADLLGPASATTAALAEEPAGDRKRFDPRLFVALDDHGIVTVVVGRPDMGQGIRSTMAMIIADELRADWKHIRVTQADADEARYGDQNTDGSHSIRSFLQPMREVGATMRVMLEQAAAQQWQVPLNQVQARDHVVHHGPTGRSLAYGQLAATARKLPLPPASAVTLLPARERRFDGREMPLIDAGDMTTGRARYGIDVHLPGMLIASIERPPTYGGKLRSYDRNTALKVPGVAHVIELPATAPPSAMTPKGGVAVLATSTWAALQGRAQLNATWEDGPHGSYDSKTYAEQLLATARQQGSVARSQGSPEQALANAARVVKAEYYVPHLAHASMEPPAATAVVQGDRCEIWACVQNPQGARDVVAEALGMPAANVTLHVTLLGGAFGRKSFHDFVVEAALLSKAVGKPVKVCWSREDDITHDYYHSVSAQHLEAGLDAGGRTVAWRHRTVFPPIGSIFAKDVTVASKEELEMGAADVPFDIPNLTLEVGAAAAHTRIGWFRSVDNIHHAFAIGSFVDELAQAAGQDARAYWAELLGPPRLVEYSCYGEKAWNYDEGLGRHPIDTGRMRAVLDAVAKQAGWGRNMPAGEGLGIAVHRSFVSYVGVVVHAKVSGDGTVAVPRVDVVADCGYVANPDRVRAMMEGAVVMGMTLAYFGEIAFRNGRVEQSNFNDYQMVRMDMAPRETHVTLLPSEGLPGGAGEPGLPPVAPALCNAIFAACGRRLRKLPIGNPLNPA